MALIVQKYGGTSVGSPIRIQAVAQRIESAWSQGNQVVVVVSAMGHTTDELIDLAHQISENPPHREMDMLLTAGERISMALLSMALAEKKVPALSLTGSQTGIITDSSHRRARIKKILGDRVRVALADKKVVIVAGFQGVSETKEITTLGRGGSDTTAVALAAALKAEVCEIYTDVDGVYTADPRIVNQAKLWKRIPHDLMVEMATRGAGVLHPRCVEIAKKFKVPLKVKNSLNENEGTEVIDRKEVHSGGAGNGGMEDFAVAGVTADHEKAIVKVELARPTAFRSLWDQASQAHLSVVAPAFLDGKVQFFSDREAAHEWKKIFDHLTKEGFVKSYQIDLETVPLTVVGDRFSQDGTALHEVFDVLAQEQIWVQVGSASALAITVAVPRSRANEGVQILHKRFLGSD